jgi:putative transposase
MNKPVKERIQLVENEPKSLSMATQCRLLNIHRSGLYYRAVAESEEIIQLMLLMDEQFTQTPS